MGSYLSVCGVLSQPEATVCHPAMALGPEQRRDLALHALAGTTPISRLAAEHEVSRKFGLVQFCPFLGNNCEL